MPLHLLGKKSWNVYNSDNVERVRRDEAEAKAREEAEEQCMQEEDAQRRIAILRGEKVAPLPPPEGEEVKDDGQAWRQRRSDDTYVQRDRKRRRLRGEDDTDRDIRYAQQHTAETSDKRKRELLTSQEREAPLEDHAGHFQLIPAPDEVTTRNAEKNAEAEAEKAKKRKREEDQYTMRFTNAAGFQNGMKDPWYTSKNVPAPAKDVALAEVQGNDVWGNEDPRRREREQNRISSNDPFAAMQQAQRQLKQSEKDRELWERQQKAEIERLKKEHRRDRHRRSSKDDQDSLDGFSLDAPAEKTRNRDDRKHRNHRHHHRRHRSRSRSRERIRERDDKHYRRRQER